MEVRIKTINGDSELPPNLRQGVIYQATRIDTQRMKVTCDDGQIITTNIKKSGYLGDYGEWEIVSEVVDIQKNIIEEIQADKQENPIDQFIADGGFDQAFNEVFGLPESVIESLKEVC